MLEFKKPIRIRPSVPLRDRLKVPLDEFLLESPPESRIEGGSKPRTYNPDLPLFSIVTPAWNAAKTLARTIESVAAQTYPNIEYIICDGGSKDGTIDFLKAHDHLITYWLSERDRAAEEACNRGLARITGDYFAFLCADDWFAPNFAAVAVETMRAKASDYVYGGVFRHEADGTPLFATAGTPDADKYMLQGFTIVSPSFAVSRHFVDTVGGFDGVRAQSDYDWFLRAHLAGLRGTYNPDLMVHYSAGGHSDKGIYMVLSDQARLALSAGGPPIPILARYFKAVSPILIRDLAKMVLPEQVFNRLRNAIRRLRHSR